jgi:hypothetical protein
VSETENPKNEGEQKPPQRRIQRTLAPNFASYYANNSEVGMTMYDITIRFGRIIGAEADALRVEDQALVTMSLPHAKALLLILNSYVSQYEKDNGFSLPTPFAPLVEVEVEQKVPTGLYNVEGEK